MKSIILKGGLGNQLFQLSKFLDLYKRGIKDIKFDATTGFLLDFKYRRKLEINNLEKNFNFTKHFETTLNLFAVVLYKFCPLLLKILRIKVIDDNNSGDLVSMTRENIIFCGYFQNFNILDSNLEKVYEIVKPNFRIKKSKKFNNLISEIKKYDNSIALGIRFYEESNNPQEHAAVNSKIKRVEDFNRIIKIFEDNLKNPVFFIFVQNENDYTRGLQFRSKNYVISHANGYRGSWERLSAQANCKHHVFNNSTFYYWGASFSRFLNQNKKSDSEIYISDNFVFDQIYNPAWTKF